METGTVRTNRLEISYLHAGEEGSPAVLLLHGFPDDATSWTAVAERLAGEGFRCLAPFIRGCRGTRFLHASTPRAGDFAALGGDAIAFVEALDLRDLTVVGQDWGSPTAEIAAAFRPERVKSLVKLNWYGVYTMAEMAKAQAFRYDQLRALWYVWMLNTPLGQMVIDHDRIGFARALWDEWSPTWDDDERRASLEGASPSFEGEDWARVALAAYRAGITEAETDPADDEIRNALADPPPVKCPASLIRGKDDGVERSPLSSEAIEKYFPSGLVLTELEGVGHFPQREAAEAVANAILRHHVNQ